MSFGVIELGDTSNIGSLSISPNEENCVIRLLPGGGDPISLFQHWDCTNAAPPLTWIKTGRLRSLLVSQTLTLALNLRLSPGLPGMLIKSDVLTIAETDGCGFSNPGVPLGGTWEYYQLPSSVYTELVALYGIPTVQNLFDLADDAIDDETSVTSPLLDIAYAVAIINEAFDECKWGTFYGGFVPDSMQNSPIMIYIIDDEDGDDDNISMENTNEEDNLKLSAYPNPFSTTARIEFSIPVDGEVTLEIYNMTGVLIGKLYDGFVYGEAVYSVEFKDPGHTHQATYIYVLRSGVRVKYGRLMMFR